MRPLHRSPWAKTIVSAPVPVSSIQSFAPLMVRRGMAGESILHSPEMRRLVLVLASAACAAPPKPPAAAKPEPAAPEIIDPRTLGEELQLAVLEAYRAVAADYADAYQDTLAKDARVLLLDVRPEDLVIGADAARALQVRHYFAESRVEVVSQELEAHVAADGGAGWVHDHLSYRVGIEQRRAVLPLRSTAVYARREARWLKV